MRKVRVLTAALIAGLVPGILYVGVVAARPVSSTIGITCVQLVAYSTQQSNISYSGCSNMPVSTTAGSYHTWAWDNGSAVVMSEIYIYLGHPGGSAPEGYQVMTSLSADGSGQTQCNSRVADWEGQTFSCSATARYVFFYTWGATGRDVFLDDASVTVVDPTATATAVPPTATAVPPTATDTPGGPTNTPTDTAVPATATATDTAVPPTHTPTPNLTSTSQANQLATLVAFQLTHEAAAGYSPTPGPTPTATPTNTATPSYQEAVTFISGNQMLVERRWSFGQLFTGLALLALAAMLSLQWVYELARSGAA